MSKQDEFYVPYIEGSIGPKTKRTVKRFVLIAVLIIVLGAVIFSAFQNPFKNSSFELTSTTSITGTFHEQPYPMLSVEIDDSRYKNIVLLGFGKSSVNPYLEQIRTEVNDLNGQTLTIEGNLIYYNGKTLMQITSDEKVSLGPKDKSQIPGSAKGLGEMTLEGEIIDPKCYFGVMKPGKGKIHRSCAVRCISGGIPPVLATTDENSISEYYLLTDMAGNAINGQVLPYIGKPASITGIVERLEDWYVFRIDVADIVVNGKDSAIY